MPKGVGGMFGGGLEVALAQMGNRMKRLAIGEVLSVIDRPGQHDRTRPDRPFGIAGLQLKLCQQRVNERDV